MQGRLELGDLLLIAEAVLEESAEHLHRTVSLWRIESALAAPFASVGGVDLYPDPVERAAICCSRLVRNQPFPRKNEEIAYLCMGAMLEQADFFWTRPPGGDREADEAIRALEARTWSEEKFVSWVRSRFSFEGRR
jgi:Fic/DOC family